MSWVTSRPGGGGGGRGTDMSSVPPDLDEITDEEFLKQLWQQAEDFSDRRRIRARMYKLREKRLREMVQNDEESLGALTMTDEGDSSYQTETHTSEAQTTERKSSVEIKLDYKGDTSGFDSSSRLGQLSMRGVDANKEEDIIENRIKEVSKGRGARYQQVLSKYDDQNIDNSSTSRSSYSVQSNALTGDSYQSIKHKEVRDSISPVRGAFDRRIVGEESETIFTSDEEIMKSESESVSSRNTSRDDRSVRSTSSRKVTERKLSKELNLNSSRRTEKSSPTSPTRKVPGDTSPSKATTKRQTAAQADNQSSTLAKTKSDKRTNQSNTASRLASGRKKINEKSTKMGKEINGDYKNLNEYLNENVDSDDEIIKEEEEEAEDDDGQTVKMIVQTRKKKDGTQIISRRLARAVKIVEKESDIDEILVGNPDHEVLERDVEEKEEKDGSKIKIITETRRRPDGIVYTTKNVLKTSKIFDYDHPEDIAYSEYDELISSEESTETDENGITIKTVTETRRKKDGVEYTTKKVYKTSKVDATITPSDDDEVLDRKETEEEQSDGTILKIIIEKRRTKDGQEYTHRQVYRSRKLTLSGIDVLQGMPSVDNDDEVIDRKEKEDLDENKTKVKIVTETRRRKDGSTYSFEYILRSFKGTETDIEKMSIEAASNSSNINVSDNDKIIKEDVKEELQKDGSIVRTIIERRRAKDGTEYLRHRIMKIPKLPEPELVVGSLDDEVIEEDVKEKVLEDGTQCKAITERRRSSTTGVHYTLRRMSKIFHHHSHLAQTDEILDENITEEETGNGILVKTVIRRYERPDGTVYTTHDIQKSYNSPVAVNVDEYEKDELIDRSYDERETFDGYIIKTIIETRCRNDGTHYTIERTEKVSKLGDGIDVSFKGNSISSGSPGDAVVSCEEHEEPSEDGAIIKTILEIRRRPDGTEYTNKITIKSTEVLVPEHETSYVIIKADSKDGEGECSFFPSLEDEIVYVREKKDVDEKGNPITIVIETRKSKKTGEKYNLTKRIHTTDVVMTDKGEKILSKKLQKDDTLTRKRKPIDKVDTKKTYKITSVEKDKSKPLSSSITVNLVTKKATVNESAKRSPLKSTSVRKSPKSGSESEPSMSNSIKKPIKRSPSGDNKIQEKTIRKPVQEAKRTDVHLLKQKVSPSNSLPVTKTKVVRKPLPTKKSGRFPDSSPDQISENDSSGKESPKEESKLRSESSPKAKSPVTRVSSSPSRGRSPLRSGTSTPREGTPVRQCCRKAESESPSPNQKSYVPIVRKKLPSKDTPKVNGELKKQPRKNQPENYSTFERSPSRDSPTKIQKPKYSEKPYTPKVQPDKPNKDSNKFKKPIEDKKASPPNELSFEREPIVSLPQTPLTEEMKAYPAATSSSPFIEDVSTEPDLPYHTVHRPSLVREPSEYNPDLLNDANLDFNEPKTTETSKPKSTIDSKLYKKTSDSSPYSTSEDESKKLPSKRKDSPFKPFTATNKTFPEDRKPKPIIEKTKEEVSKSLLDQIIPDNLVEDLSSDKETERGKKIEMKNSFSAKLSMFEKPKPETKDTRTSYKPERKQPGTEKLVPVREPLIIPKYIHPLGSDSESDQDKPKKTTKDDTNLSSTRLVMSAIGSENSQYKKTHEYDTTDREKQDIVTPLRERSKSPFSKDSVSLPRSKEGSPAPFVKEDSPGRFVTGKPIDQGPNTTKIKRLERSNSNKKIIYEDLEENAANLPSYLKDIEYITDVSVLEKLLQNAETYEERRIIRGHIRTLKKVDSNLTKTTSSSSAYKRFIDTTPSKSSPTSSPLLSRRTAPTETTPSTKLAPSKRSYPKGDSRPSPLSPTEESKSFRSFASKDRRFKKRSSDESESERRTSFEEVKYERKSSSETIKKSEVKSSSVADRSREWKYTPTETTVQKSTEIYSTTKVRKESPEGRATSDRTSSPEDIRRGRSSPSYSDKYRKLSDGISKGRKISDDLVKKSSRDETVRKISSEETTRKQSREETTRKTSSEILRKTSLEETVRKSSRDDTTRKTSRGDTVRKSSRDETLRKTSRDDTAKTTSRSDTVRKTSQDETTKKVAKKISREEVTGKTSRDTLRDNISREYTRKPTSEGYERNRTSSPETPKSSRKSSPDTKSRWRTSPDRKLKEENVRDVPKDLDSKSSKPYETTIKRKTSDDLEKSVKSTSIWSKSDISSKSALRKDTKLSAELDVSRQASEKSTLLKEHQETKEKPVSRSPYLTRKQKDTPSTTTKSKETTDSPVYMEPLRHQRNAKTVISKVEQTNVDKIVSPYGVGPTDEYGLPLIGLKALKRRNQQPREEPVAPKPEKAEEEFIPSDSQGKPLFGLRALKKAPETTTFTTTQVAKESTAVQETLHNAFISTETSHLQSGVITQPETHTRETSPSLVKSVDMSLRRKSSMTESDNEKEKTVSLRDIIKLHEAKVVSDKTESSTLAKPKKKLRETFEPTSEQVIESRPHRTWDLETDLSTRSQVMENIIAKHETLTKQETVKPAKKLNGILKKTSTSSIQTSKIISSDSEGFESSEITEILERKTSKDRSPSPSNFKDHEEFAEDKTKDAERKTSYTEIKLLKRFEDGDESKPLGITKGQKSAEVKIFETVRNDKTDKKNERLEHRKTSNIISNTTLRKENATGESKKTVHKKSISEEKILTSPRDKSPTLSKDLFQVDDRKGKITSNESRLITTEKSEEKNQKKSKNIISTKIDKKSSDRIKESDITISKLGTKQAKTKPLKDSIEKDSIDGESSTESSSDESESSSSQSSVDSFKKSKSSKHTKSSSKKNSEKVKGAKKKKDLKRIDTNTITRKKSSKESKLVVEDDVSRKFPSTSSPDRSTTRRVDKESKLVVEDTVSRKFPSTSSPDRSTKRRVNKESKLVVEDDISKKIPSTSSPDRSTTRRVDKESKVIAEVDISRKFSSTSSPDHSPTRRVDKESKLVDENAVSRKYSSSSSPDRSTTRTVEKTFDKSLKDDKAHKEPIKGASKKISVKTSYPIKEEKSDKDRKISSDELAKANFKNKEDRNIFSVNRRKSSETKPSQFTSPEREGKSPKRAKSSEPVRTDVCKIKSPTNEKFRKKTPTNEKPNLNDDSKLQNFNTIKRKTHNEDKKVFGSHKKETHISSNIIDSKKKANEKDTSTKVVSNKTRSSPKIYEKLRISDIKESDKKLNLKKYDSNLEEAKKSPKDKIKLKEIPKTEKTIIGRKEQEKDEINRKSSTTEQYRIQNKHTTIKTKVLNDSDDVNSGEKIATKNEISPVRKGTQLKPKTKDNESTPKHKTREIENLPGKDLKIKKTTKDDITVRNETLGTEQSSVKKDKRNIEISDIYFNRENIYSLKDKRRDSEKTFSTKKIDQTKIKVSDESSESETAQERIKIVNKYSSDEEHASKLKSSTSLTNEEKRKTYNVESDQNITEKRKSVEINKEEFTKQKLDRIDLTSEKEIITKKEEKGETDIRRVSDAEDKTQNLHSETRVNKKSFDTIINLINKTDTQIDKDTIQSKKPKSQESKSQIVSEKITEVHLDEEEKDKKVSKSSKFDITKSQETINKIKPSHREDTVKKSKEEINKHVNKEDKKREPLISDVKESPNEAKVSRKSFDNDINMSSKSETKTDRDKIQIKKPKSQDIKSQVISEKKTEVLLDEEEKIKVSKSSEFGITRTKETPNKTKPSHSKEDILKTSKEEINILINTQERNRELLISGIQEYENESKVNKKSFDTDLYLINKLETMSDENRTQSKKTKNQERKSKVVSEKKTEVLLDEEEKIKVSKSSELEITRTQEEPNKIKPSHRKEDTFKTSKEEVNKHINQQGKKREILISDVQESPDLQSEKLKSKQNIKGYQKTLIEDELSIKVDSNVEIKTTSDSEISDDTKQTYKKQIEVRDKDTGVRDEEKRSDISRTEKSKVFSQNIVDTKSATTIKESKDIKEEKLRKNSLNTKINKVSEKERKISKEEVEVNKKTRPKKSIEKNDVFCTVDGRIIDKQTPLGKRASKISPDVEIISRKKSSPSSENISHDTKKIGAKKESKHQTANKVPKNSPATRYSKSPEPEEISRRLRKLSKQRKTSAENIQDSKERKDSDSLTSSLQSLSVASTTSSVPGYMRPRRDSKSYKRQTPERDLQEVEDLLLNSYQYTRCTKRVVKPPVKYDYTYVINTNEGAAGGKDTYSIYFGPREKAPLMKNNTSETTTYGDTYVKHSKDESTTSSRKTSIDTVSSSQKNFIENEDIKIKEMKTDVITENERLKLSTDKISEEDKYLDIKMEYENKIKAIDLKHNSPRDDSQQYQRKESDSRYNEDIQKNFENKGTFSDIRQQYEDTVRSIAEDSFRKSSFTSESKSKESKIDNEDPSLLKYKELASKDYKDYGIDNKQQSTLYSVTDLRNLSKKDDLVTSSSYDNRDVRELQTETQTKVVDNNQRSQVSRDINTVNRNEMSVSSESKDFEKQFDSTVINKSHEPYIKESLSTGNDIKNFDKTNTLKNIKFLPDYDYNKIYASKTLRNSPDSQQIFSSDEQYSSSKTNNSQTTKRDNSTYVTFDGRTVTTSGGHKDYDQGDSTGAFNKMADDKHGNVGQSDLRSSRFVQQDDNFHEESMNRKCSSSAVVLDSNTTSSTTVQAMNRTPTSDLSNRSFLDDRSKVTGISDVLSRMGASEAVDHESKITSDDQARSLLNKFLGAQVLMTGVESMMANSSTSQASSHTSMTRGSGGNVAVTRNVSGEHVTKTLKDGDVVENRKTFSTGPQTISYNVSSSSPKTVVEGADIVKGVNINEVTDDFALNQLLDSCEEYDERRRVRLRLKELMAEKKALQKQLSGHEKGDVYSSSRRTVGVSGSKGSDLQTGEGFSSFNVNRGSSQVSTQKSSFSSSYSTKSFQSSKDTKNSSALDKFKQLDSSNVNQNQSSKGPPIGQGPLFQLTTSLSRSASGVKDMILTWCQCRTRDYKGVKIENFSTSWNDGMAFCALIHHFYPDAFDFNSLEPRNRRHNFSLAFRVADERAGIMPLLDVEDMVMMKKPDWKCVFTYVQSLYKRLKDE